MSREQAAAHPDRPGRNDFQLRARLGTGPERLLAEAHPHGLPAWPA
ncbi:hypothetical protein [Micromonospora sp. NPDC023633]